MNADTKKLVVEAAQNGLKWPGGKIDEYVPKP